MSGMTANGLYGRDPAALQPTATPEPDHLGAPEPTVATMPPPSRTQSPLIAVLVILAAVVLLTQLSFRGTVAVKG